MGYPHISLAQSSTQEKSLSFEEEWAISLGQFVRLPKSQRSVLLSMLGRDGKLSLTDSIDTQMQWLATLDMKRKERALTLILVCRILPILLGTPLPDSN